MNYTYYVWIDEGGFIVNYRIHKNGAIEYFYKTYWEDSNYETLKDLKQSAKKDKAKLIKVRF